MPKQLTWLPRSTWRTMNSNLMAKVIDPQIWNSFLPINWTATPDATHYIRTWMVDLRYAGIIYHCRPGFSAELECYICSIKNTIAREWLGPLGRCSLNMMKTLRDIPRIQSTTRTDFLHTVGVLILHIQRLLRIYDVAFTNQYTSYPFHRSTYKLCCALNVGFFKSFLTSMRKTCTSSAVIPLPLVKTRSEIPSNPSRKWW